MRDTDRPPSWIELESVQPMPIAEEITSLSADTLRRRYSRYVVKLSPRRDGLKLRDCLAIASGMAQQG
jgi:hypothetical protein